MRSDVGVLHCHPSMNNQWFVVAQYNPIFTSTQYCRMQCRSYFLITGYWTPTQSSVLTYVQSPSTWYSQLYHHRRIDRTKAQLMNQS